MASEVEVRITSAADPSHRLLSLEREDCTAFKEPLQLIVMSVIVVIFYTYGVLHDVNCWCV